MDFDDDRSERLLWVALGGAAPIVVAAALVAVRDVVLNANVALVLVLVIVVAAIGGGRQAGAVAAVSAALAFDFFHTTPYLTLQINSDDDVETTVLLLVVGLVVGHLASVRQRRATPRESTAEEIQRIHRVAAMTDGGRHTTADMIMVAQHELSALLGLRSCQFEAFPFEQPPLPRMDRSGVVAVMEYHPDGFALPADGAELPVLGRGNVLGRFVLVPQPNTVVTLEQRVVAVAIADQVGAALVTNGTPPAANNEKGITHG